MSKIATIQALPEDSAYLLFGDSRSTPNLFFLGNVEILDPFFALLHKGISTAVVSPLEYTRVCQFSRFDTVINTEALQKKLPHGSKKRDKNALYIAYLAQEQEIENLFIEANFPYGLAQELLEYGLTLHFMPENLFPGRIEKDMEAQAALIEANKASAAGIEAAFQAFKETRIQDGFLYLGGEKLTSERLRYFVNKACLELNAVAQGTIIAGGRQACNPHERGSGPLKANELIIVDVFPRAEDTGYYGDMTRTFLKGKPNPEQMGLVEAVQIAQKKALAALKPQVNASIPHERVSAYFKEVGYQTSCDANGVYSGFFHGTGHGLGLELHEKLRLSPNQSHLLAPGNVVTVEPGLYYPDIGGCRIEDVVVINDSGYKLLSNYHYTWKID